MRIGNHGFGCLGLDGARVLVWSVWLREEESQLDAVK